jgi:hypothetical protein
MKNSKNAEAAIRKNGEDKMKMIEKAMHGKNAGKRESKNYRHKCKKGCNCN